MAFNFSNVMYLREKKELHPEGNPFILIKE